jgi:hypothetical protein
MFLRVVRAAGGKGVKHEYVRVVEASVSPFTTMVSGEGSARRLGFVMTGGWSTAIDICSPLPPHSLRLRA